jgi:hypothetical protein
MRHNAYDLGLFDEIYTTPSTRIFRVGHAGVSWGFLLLWLWLSLSKGSVRPIRPSIPSRPARLHCGVSFGSPLHIDHKYNHEFELRP